MINETSCDCSEEFLSRITEETSAISRTLCLVATITMQCLCAKNVIKMESKAYNRKTIPTVPIDIYIINQVILAC